MNSTSFFRLLTIVYCSVSAFPFLSVGRANDWAVGRGDSASTAVANAKLSANPTLLWEYKTESDKSGFEGTPVIADGRVFVGDFDGTVHAIDLITGKSVWKVKKKDGFVTAAAVQNNRVVLGDFSGIVYCLDAKTGEEIWVRELDQQVASGANFFNDNVVLLTSESGSLFALDLQSGDQKWKYETGDQLRSSPTIWKQYSMLGGCDGKLHKIDLASGSSAGEGVALQAPTLSTPSIIGKFAIVPTQPGVVMAIDVETEKILWTFAEQSQANDIRSSPAALGKFENETLSGIAVVTTRNKRLLGLDLKDGTVKWEAVLKKKADSSPVICDGRAWVGALDGMVYAFDLTTGQETWTYQLSGQILASPAIASDRLIIATEKGSLYCFGS